MSVFIQKIYLESQKHQDQSSDIVRHEKSAENFIYILDENIQISDKDKRKLRGLINFGVTFNDIKDKACTEFITNIVNEQIIMILSRTSMENLDTNIRNTSQLRFIYIVDNTKDWSNDFEKIRGIYTNIAKVCDQLENDIKLFTYDLTTILSVPANDTSDSTFAYVQILKDILLEIDDKTDLKTEMLDFCRQVYADNEIQLTFIDEFELHFRPDEAIKWYIRQETFLFKILSRAFRIPDPDILFKLRFFIQYLHHQLKSNISTTSMTVYRTQHISNDDFDTILKNQGGFLAFNEFLSTNKDKIKSKQKIIDLPFNKSAFKLVLFQMQIGTTIPKMNIETIPEEILLTAATIFRISNVEQIDKKIPIVELISNDDVLKAAQKITKNVREAARGPFPLLRIAKLMKHMEYIQYIEYFSLKLIDDPIVVNNELVNLILGGLFHILCTFYYEQEQYDRALDHLHKSFKVYSRVLYPDDIKLTPTYNNMGSIYHKKGLDEQALQFHKKAYDIQVKSSNPDPDSVAAYAGNIASVLLKQGKYEEAIPYLQRDLQIQQRLYSNNDDINLAVKYHNLAGAQFRINKYTEALDNYKKCLKIELKIHPSNHPTVAVTYYNMATTLEGLGQLEEAIKTIQKARKRLLLTRDENDEEVQAYKEYEKRLQQKLWIKSLFNTT
jgi:tetratricopeptide (TPR) repeat protein